jgi:hypothetical protein
MEIRVVNKDGKTHGLNKAWYKNGILSHEFPYKNGKIHGLTKQYYETGNILEIGSFKNGQLHGVFKTFYENGVLAKETMFKNGIQHGFETLYKESGGVVSLILYKDGLVAERDKNSLSNSKEKQMKLPIRLNDALENFAQSNGKISYSDISKMNVTSRVCSSLNKLLDEYFDFEEGSDELVKIENKIVNIIKG